MRLNRIVISFVGIALLTNLLGAWSIYSLRYLTGEHEALIEHEVQDLLDIERVQTAVQRRTAAIRGFLFAEFPPFEEELVSSVEDYDAPMKRLMGTPDGPVESEWLARIDELARQLRGVQDELLRRKRAGAARPGLVGFFEQECFPRNRKLDALIGEFVQHKETELVGARKEAGATSRSLVSLMAAMVGVTMLATAGLFVLLLRSLRQRRQSEAALAESRVQLEKALDVGQLGSWSFEIATQTVQLSSRALRILGLDESQNEVRAEELTPCLDPEDLASANALGQLAFEKGQPFILDLKFKRVDTGEARWIHVRAAVAGELPSQTDRLIGVIQDITERKNAEAEKEELYRRAQEALEARDEFISIASHELRTPLTSLKLQAPLIRRWFAALQGMPPGTERYLTLLDDMVRQVDRLHRLVMDMLDISRISHHRLAFETNEFDFAETVRDVVQRFKEMSASSGCSVNFHSSGPIRMTGDRFRVEQVAINLISNAIKYGARKDVEVSVEAIDETAWLRVRDRGIGIAQEDLGRIFHRFERAVPGERIAGLGLGLYIVQHIVHAHGGRIHVESELGKGSVFSVELPLRAAFCGLARVEAEESSAQPGEREA